MGPISRSKPATFNSLTNYTLLASCGTGPHGGCPVARYQVNQKLA
jgi:hypothetical protein